MTTRTLTITGQKIGTDPAAVQISIQPWLFFANDPSFTGQDDQQTTGLGEETLVYAGEVTNTTVGTICTYDITVGDMSFDQIDNLSAKQAVVNLTNTYLVKVRCTQGRVSVASVSSPALNETDQYAVVPDPAFFAESFPVLNNPLNRTAPYPTVNREASQDPKHDVRLNGNAVNITAEPNDRGPWHHEIPMNSELSFQIMITNLIAYKEPGFVPPQVLWQQLEKPLRGETYGDQ